MSKESSKEITLVEFLTLTRVMRMLYGVEVSTHFFETNFEKFTGHSLKDFKDLLMAKSNGKLRSTHED